MSDLTLPSNRLGLYKQAIQKMKAREFSISFPEKGNQAPIWEFETELIELAAWLEVQFDKHDKLQDISAEISKGNMLDDVLDRIYNVFQSVIPYDRIGCALLSEDGEKVIARWTKTNYPERVKIVHGFSARLAGSSLESTLSNRQPRILNDLQEYLRKHPDSLSTKLIVAEGIQSSLTCPLITEDKPIGFLFFSSKEKNTYRDAHQKIFVNIARQVSILIEKSRLYQHIFSLNQKLTKAMAQLQEQSCRDALTGIFHRGAIMEFLQQSLKEGKRKIQPVTLIMTDLDHFKSINDTYGHSVGDTVLKQTTQAIKQQLRDYDNVGRYGGEEFLIVLSNTSLTKAEAIAERIRQNIASLTFEHTSADFSVTASMGIACSDCHPRLDEQNLLNKADEALYQAKHNGRNQVVSNQT